MSDGPSIPLDFVYDTFQPMRAYRHRVGRRLKHYAFNYSVHGVHTLMPLYMHVWSVNKDAARRAARRRIAHEVSQRYPGHTWGMYGGSLVRPLPRRFPCTPQGTRKSMEAFAAFISKPLLQVMEQAPVISDLFSTSTP